MVSILDDPRYHVMVDLFQFDPLGFCVSVCGTLPSQDQEELCNALIEPDAKVSVVSGTSTGKTHIFARIALWHFFCYPLELDDDGGYKIGSNTYIGAPRIKQVSEGIWKELTDAQINISQGSFAWLNSYYQINAETVVMKGFEKSWYISQVAMQQGKAIGVAGKHRYWQLIIIDEAAGVSDEHFDVIDGTQTQGGNRTLMASQGVKNSGRFYESHHKLSKARGGSWTALRFNSEHSPIVTNKWLKDRADETGGRNSMEYGIRVLGLFANSAGGNLINRAEMDRAFGMGQIIGDDEPYGLLLLVDVGMGEYRDDSVAIVAKVIGYGDNQDENARRVEYIAMPYCTNSTPMITFAGDLVNLFGTLSNATLLVDNGGVGRLVNDLIEGSGVPVTRIDWGIKCFRKEYRMRFINRRACAMVRFRDAIRDGRLSIRLDLDRRTREKIIDQGARLPYVHKESGGLRYAMLKKVEMRKKGIGSPDIIDSMSFAWLEDAVYIPSGNAAAATGAALKVTEEVKWLFSDLIENF